MMIYCSHIFFRAPSIMSVASGPDEGRQPPSSRYGSRCNPGAIPSVRSPAEDSKIHLDADMLQNGNSTQQSPFEDLRDITTGPTDMEGTHRLHKKLFAPLSSLSSAKSGDFFNSVEVHTLGLGTTLIVISIVVLFCEFDLNWAVVGR